MQLLDTVFVEELHEDELDPDDDELEADDDELEKELDEPENEDEGHVDDSSPMVAAANLISMRTLALSLEEVPVGSPL